MQKTYAYALSCTFAFVAILESMKNLPLSITLTVTGKKKKKWEMGTSFTPPHYYKSGFQNRGAPSATLINDDEIKMYWTTGVFLCFLKLCYTRDPEAVSTHVLYLSVD